jgi:hypothetical protein
VKNAAVKPTHRCSKGLPGARLHIACDYCRGNKQKCTEVSAAEHRALLPTDRSQLEQVPFEAFRRVNRLLLAQDSTIRNAPPGIPEDHAHYEPFRRQAAEIISWIQASKRAQRGERALLQGIWQRLDYTNDLLLSLLNHQRFRVSESMQTQPDRALTGGTEPYAVGGGLGPWPQGRRR